MPIHELAALGAATCWAMTGLISAGPAGHLGALAFNRARQIFVTALLGLYVLFTGAWHELTLATSGPLLLSGLIGIFIGDTLLFATLNRLGPRRSGILFALNAPISALLGWLMLGETLSGFAVAGVALTASGVFLAILFGKRRAQMHQWETVKGSLAVGVLLGIGAATGQAIGSIIARPAMETGIDPFLASLLRVGIAATCLSILIQLTALTGVLALAIGMTLLLFALSGGKVGIVSTLSATSPAIILPMLWLRTGERPAGGAWAGAALVIVGMAFIFIR